MAAQIETIYRQQYADNFGMLFQQRGSRLRRCVFNDDVAGKQKLYDRVGVVEARERTIRHSDVEYDETPTDRRKVSLREPYSADLIDQIDKVKMIGDPTNAFVLARVNAIGRKIDRYIISAFNGTAYGGYDGSVAIPFPSGQIIANNYDDKGGSSSTNLTVAKLRKAKEKLDAAEATLEGAKRYVVCTASSLHSMLTALEYTSRDYNAVKALVDGEAPSFLGFEFVRTELLPVVGGYRQCFAFMDLAMVLGMNKDIETTLDIIPTKHNSVQIYAKMWADSTRLFEQGVVQINCDESAF